MQTGAIIVCSSTAHLLLSQPPSSLSEHIRASVFIWTSVLQSNNYSTVCTLHSVSLSLHQSLFSGSKSRVFYPALVWQREQVEVQVSSASRPQVATKELWSDWSALSLAFDSQHPYNITTITMSLRIDSDSYNQLRYNVVPPAFVILFTLMVQGFVYLGNPNNEVRLQQSASVYHNTLPLVCSSPWSALAPDSHGLSSQWPLHGPWLLKKFQDRRSSKALRPQTQDTFLYMRPMALSIMSSPWLPFLPLLSSTLGYVPGSTTSLEPSWTVSICSPSSFASGSSLRARAVPRWSSLWSKTCPTFTYSTEGWSCIHDSLVLTLSSGLFVGWAWWVGQFWSLSLPLPALKKVERSVQASGSTLFSSTCTYSSSSTGKRVILTLSISSTTGPDITSAGDAFVGSRLVCLRYVYELRSYFLMPMSWVKAVLYGIGIEWWWSTVPSWQFLATFSTSKGILLERHLGPFFILRLTFLPSTDILHLLHLLHGGPP